jgi:hypothetical protein
VSVDARPREQIRVDGDVACVMANYSPKRRARLVWLWDFWLGEQLADG